MINARLTLSIALAAAVVATGCKKDADDNGAGATTGATTSTTTATTTDTTAMKNSAAPALTDANIAWILDQANAADSARGSMAATKGTDPEVKSFGKLMMGEHHALRMQGQQLVKKLNVTPTAPAGDQSEAMTKTESDSLTAMPKGKAWDKAYIDYEVNYHEQVLKTATAALGAAQNAELKALITKAAPIIQHHLDKAKAIQKKLS